METPLVSVIMNCRNGEQFVEDAIRSVLDQTMGDLELVFWDNLSTDRTAEIVNNIEDSRIKYMLSDSDDRLGQARNRAFVKATGKWLAIIDSDDTWHPEFLQRQLDVLDRTGASMVYSNATSFYPDGRERPYSESRARELQTIDYQTMALDYDICISAVIFEREILDNLSYIFDPEQTVSEEKDLFIRIAHKYQVIYNPETLARYRMHAESDTWRKADDFIRDARKILVNMENAGIDPEFARQHFMDFAYWVAAKGSWMNSDGPMTRLHLGKMSFSEPRVILLYILSFIPYRWVSPLLRMTGKRII